MLDRSFKSDRCSLAQPSVLIKGHRRRNRSGVLSLTVRDDTE
jgi:hypothetical protein